MILTAAGPAASGEAPRIEKANDELGARFSAARVGKMVFDTSVNPRWFESGDRFWYSDETGRGKTFWIVDPARRVKTPVFDNARLAAMLTRISLFPYDAQHLPIKTLKFVKKDTAVMFELEVPKDALLAPPGKPVRTVDEILGEQQQKGQKGQDQDKEKDKEKSQEKDKEKESKTKTLFFEYDLARGTLNLLPNYQAPPKKARWASLSPDAKTVVFARGHNLFMMDAQNYALAQKKADHPKIKEIQITQDGEEHYSYARRLRGEERKDYQKDEKSRKDPRVPPVTIVWSKDSRKFALTRDDARKVADLWVINSLADPRPTFETYRDEMPGDENIPQPEILVFNRKTRAAVKVKAGRFKDQSLDIATAAMLVYPDFFKVAVSSYGNHENNVYNKWWSETHHGVKEVVDKDGTVKFEYSNEKNSELAKNLKGHLLLTTGDMDDNVHMANTLRLASALVNANKRFDLFILPGQRHGYGDMADYFFWLRADYFCRHLLGDVSQSVDIEEINVEKEQSGDKKAKT